MQTAIEYKYFATTDVFVAANAYQIVLDHERYFCVLNREIFVIYVLANLLHCKSYGNNDHEEAKDAAILLLDALGISITPVQASARVATRYPSTTKMLLYTLLC